MSADLEPLAMDVYGLMRTRFPDHTPVTSSRKVVAEAGELADNPDNLTEAADVLITLMGWLVAAKYSPQELISAAETKMRVNHARTWTRQPDGTYQHEVAS